MNNIIYIVGLVVIVIAVLSFFGLRQTLQEGHGQTSVPIGTSIYEANAVIIGVS